MNNADGSLDNTFLPLGKPSVFELLQSECEGWDVVTFWSSYTSFLASHEVYLYEMRETSYGGRAWVAPSSSCARVTFPYLPTVAHTQEDLNCLKNHVAPARDIHHRDLVVKLIDNNSEELAINTFLLGREEFSDSKKFPCVLPPVKIIPSPHNFSFLVMPRWKRYVWSNSLPDVGEVLNVVRCLLKGLDYLHEHRIVHRDINDRNVLKDIGAKDSDWKQGLPDHSPLPSYDGKLYGFRTRYCLFDFDLALKLPPNTSLRDCRIPAVGVFGWGTSWTHPKDAEQGEYEFNPFAFDVACLGNFLLGELFYAIPSIPLLIPLLDRMTTHAISQRFTAAQALSFWEEVVQSISQTEWDAPFPERDNTLDTPTFDDLWKNAPNGFAETWKMYCSPPVPLMTRFLRWICSLNSYRAMIVVRFIRHHLKW